MFVSLYVSKLAFVTFIIRKLYFFFKKKVKFAVKDKKE